MDFKAIFKAVLLPLVILLIISLISLAISYYVASVAVQNNKTPQTPLNLQNNTQKELNPPNNTPINGGESDIIPNGGSGLPGGLGTGSATNPWTLQMDIEKTSYALNEPFRGRRNLSFAGNPFNVIIMDVYSQDDLKYFECKFEELATFFSRGKFLNPFNLTSENGEISFFPKKFFEKEGTYKFETAVFKCDKVQTALGLDCEQAASSKESCKQVFDEVQSIESVEKAITITAVEVPPKIDASLLTLDLIAPKTDYLVGEEFSGERVLDFSGEPFEGLIMNKYTSSKGNHYQCFIKTIQPGVLEEEDLSNLSKGKNFTAFADTKDILLIRDSFAVKGDFTFKTAVYDCPTIESALLVDEFFQKLIMCSGLAKASSDRNCELVEKNLEAVKEVEKTITVASE